MSSREVLLDIFNLVKDIGYEYSQSYSDDFKDLKHILKLSKEISLVFKLHKDNSAELQLQRELPDGAIAIYENKTHVIIRNHLLSDVSVSEGLLKFNLQKESLEEIKQNINLFEIKKIGRKIIENQGTRHSAEYYYIHLLPIRLYDYTMNENVLQYFEKNDLVLKINNESTFMDVN